MRPCCRRIFSCLMLTRFVLVKANSCFHSWLMPLKRKRLSIVCTTWFGGARTADSSATVMMYPIQEPSSFLIHGGNWWPTTALRIHGSTISLIRQSLRDEDALIDAISAAYGSFIMA